MDVDRDLFRGTVQQETGRSCGVPDNGNLAKPHHPLAKIAINGNQHREPWIHFALRDLHVNLDAFPVTRLNLILELIAGHLRSVYPFAEKPIGTAVSFEIQIFAQVAIDGRFKILG